jgi:DNA polymerase alpha-associated DNA helicase A
MLPEAAGRSLDILTRNYMSEMRKRKNDMLKELEEDRSAGLEGKGIEDCWGAQTIQQMEQEFVALTVKRSKVVLATLHGGASKEIHAEKFDVVIIDESCQALEAQCWIPLLLANDMTTSTTTKLILAGDPYQLAPTIKSQRNISKPQSATEISTSLEMTLFSRLLALHGESIKRTLTTQYRMHKSIMAFPSLALYNSRLVASASVASRLLSTSLPYRVTATENTSIPLLFIDTQGGSFPEDPRLDTPSKSNTREARIVSHHVHSLITSGVLPHDIAVVTPYSAQVTLISEHLRPSYPDVEVNSIDSVQGQEKEAVVLSLVRSNRRGEIGFLTDEKRMNVAITRARCHLCVVGDGETISRGGRRAGKNGKEFLPWWVEWLESEESGCEVRYPDLVEVLRGWVGAVDIGEEDE